MKCLCEMQPDIWKLTLFADNSVLKIQEYVETLKNAFAVGEFSHSDYSDFRTLS